MTSPEDAGMSRPAPPPEELDERLASSDLTAAERPSDPLEAIVWHLDGIDAQIYEDRCDIATRHLIADELNGIHQALTVLRASVEADPSPRAAALVAPEGTSTPPVSAHTTMLLNTIGRQRDQLTETTADRDALRAERDEEQARRVTAEARLAAAERALIRFQHWTPEHTIEQWLGDVQTRLGDVQTRLNECRAKLAAAQAVVDAARSVLHAYSDPAPAGMTHRERCDGRNRPPWAEVEPMWEALDAALSPGESSGKGEA